MNYYAHSAGDGEGRQLPEQHWQPLPEHLRNVAKVAKQFAESLGLAAEAQPAGFLHHLAGVFHSVLGSLNSTVRNKLNVYGPKPNLQNDV